ncbi:gamma-glutamylcyclotransferase [Metapseudomonas lalkuanensis]|uniref:glutathione-specific gamma-glutamylcyclotransferase n=1 Tax=Metapseudomonas lalkuanensis TaxID=2604832 RepID=A0A5J6QHP6_9GAMM|nr:gamma-glutamylcyclotransferase [Pseudomonas lalkuanensis]QEY62007.1 gamma-glutamylcyclotransferase [Pseudomonas lalkuanensis]UCO99789.1 gamma-glutamylcyclotransferase [Pseudomonas lalkuanensis]
MTGSNHDTPFTPYPPLLDQPAQLTRAELLASLENTMARHQGGPVWLFAYGSLIWRPECPTMERRRARIHGYHRGLYLWSLIHRGTPETPGLVLGLDRGGSCAGFAYRLPGEQLEEHLFALWQREMPDAAYQPKWLNCQLVGGPSVQALGFVLRRDFACYAGALPDHVLRQVFDNASGRYGSTRDYVERTASILRANAMPDRKLEEALVRCCKQGALSFS